MAASKRRYQTAAYRQAREQAFARYRGRCVSCGAVAEHAHHWSLRYGPIGTETADDLVPMCRVCHEWSSKYRWFRRHRLAKTVRPGRIIEAIIEEMNRESEQP